MLREAPRIRRAITALLLCGVALCTSGCFLFRSSAASVSVSSASISMSSSSALFADNQELYARDIAALTGAAVEAGAGPAQVLRGVGHTAREHGIADWEALEVSYVAMGVGLRQGGLDPVDAERFARELCGGDAEAEAALMRGYEAPG